MDNKILQMQKINEVLKKAAKSYYSDSVEIISNAEYDKLYDELLALEKETGVILQGSMTQKVGFEVATALKKVRHPEKMLSLDKTKDREALKSWLGDNTGFLSWKLDGLTVVLTYENGSLLSAVTRGNGEVGEDVTQNAKHIAGIPLKIPVNERLVVRGEVLMKYSEFERVNNLLDVESKYKNPRNLAAGTLRQLDSSVLESRHLDFFAFNLVEGSNINEFSKRLDFLASVGFQRVEGFIVDNENILEKIEYFEKTITKNDFPSDGLVLMLENVSYGKSLGNTAKYPRNAMAFKWKDETAETKLCEIEWSASRTGLLNPVAVFEPVDLEGTKVSRASVHNVSVVRSLGLKAGDKIKVYKANMIIPQILENETPSNDIDIPKVCPVCANKTEIEISDGDIETLVCKNPDCAAKHVGKFEHFASRDAMNIVGFSTAMTDTFVSHGFIKTFSDFYHLENFKQRIITLDKMGIKSYENLIKSVENSRNTNGQRVIYALGIKNVGLAAAGLIWHRFEDISSLPKLGTEDFLFIDGIGETIAKNLVDYFKDEKNLTEFESLLSELNIAKPQKYDEKSEISGLTFVITGDVNEFKNRSELKKFIESRGGKVTSSVSKNTDYLINNDVMSNSSKNKKAKELSVKIISEKDFLDLAGLK